MERTTPTDRPVISKVKIKVGGVYMIKQNGEKVPVEIIRTDIDSEGRRYWMGVNHRAILVRITNSREVLEEIEQKPIFWGPSRGFGVDECTQCGELLTANHLYFPGHYSGKEAETLSPPICHICQGKREGVEKRKGPWEY